MLLVRKIAQGFSEDIRFSPAPIEALHEDAESYLVSLFKSSNLCEYHPSCSKIEPYGYFSSVNSSKCSPNIEKYSSKFMFPFITTNRIFYFHKIPAHTITIPTARALRAGLPKNTQCRRSLPRRTVFLL